MASSRLFVAVLLTVCISAVLASYPTLTSISQTIPTAGLAGCVDLVGEHFDTIDTIDAVYIGGREVTSASIVDDTHISLTGIPMGWGQDIEVRVVYNTTSEVKARIADYTPVDTADFGFSFLGDAVSHDIVRSLSDPATVITITGANFGEANENFTGIFRVVAGDYDATVTLHEDDLIYATFPVNGAGKNLPVVVILGTQRATVAGVTLTYPAPTVTGIVIDGQLAKRATYVPVIIYGTGFGLPGHSTHITVTIGSFPCISVNHVSGTELRCRVAGSGSNQPVSVSINGQVNVGATTFGSSSYRFDFPNPVTPGLETCVPPAGSSDALTPEICNCWSGYAPLDTVANADCQSRAVCPGKTISASVVAESAPSRPATYFQDDKLWIKQTAPIVKNRRDTIIQFAAPNLAGSPVAAGTLGASTCNYPGTIWAKKVNSLDCLDEFYGVLPWSQNGLCGFVEDPASIANPTTRWFKSNLVTTYTETFKRADGSIHFRKISNSYLITVSFTKQITALTSTPVTVSLPDVGPVNLDISISGDALYDVATKNTIISFVTTTSWPYKIANSTLPADWRKALGSHEANVATANVTLAVPQPGDLVCNDVGGTDCEQAWVLVINTQPADPADAVCNLAGKVEVNTYTLFCRDYQPIQACAGAPETNFTIVIGTTDLCEHSSEEADASKGLTYSMETFLDAEMTTPQNVFQTGDFVYAKVIVSDPQATIDTVTFNFVTVKSADPASSVHTDVYALPAHGSYASIKADGDAVGFNVTQEFTTPYLAPGNTAELQFRFRLDRDDLDVIQHLSSADPSDMTQQVTIEAILDINYHGNQKRSISLTNSNSVPAVAHSMITFYDMEVVEELEGHNNDQTAEDAYEFSLFASSSSAVVASVAAVVAAAAFVVA
jgi:exosome complex RNA-binding protein Csl4